MYTTALLYFSGIFFTGIFMESTLGYEILLILYGYIIPRLHSLQPLHSWLIIFYAALTIKKWHRDNKEETK
jgi:hypothetical protein